MTFLKGEYRDDHTFIWKMTRLQYVFHTVFQTVPNFFSWRNAWKMYDEWFSYCIWQIEHLFNWKFAGPYFVCKTYCKCHFSVEFTSLCIERQFVCFFLLFWKVERLWDKKIIIKNHIIYDNKHTHTNNNKSYKYNLEL